MIFVLEDCLVGTRPTARQDQQKRGKRTRKRKQRYDEPRLTGQAEEDGGVGATSGGGNR